ncbi:MAG: hypothetical protein HFI08_00750 [Bacilli bacterium]|jgi:uncharacterized membrane protein HdeD (DUF308 family)|nr:hypothetical protein [Bacilli bacterium]
MKGKIIIPNQTKNTKVIASLITLVLGIILVTNSNQIVTITFQIIGGFIILFGIYHFLKYFKIKKQFKMDDNNALMAGISSITIGLLIIILAGVLEIGLRYILGLILIIHAINKLNLALLAQNSNKNRFISNLITSIIFLIIGLYTIFFANAALIFIGIVLIISSLLDLLSLLK